MFLVISVKIRVSFFFLFEIVKIRVHNVNKLTFKYLSVTANNNDKKNFDTLSQLKIQVKTLYLLAFIILYLTWLAKFLHSL